jgi:hypothetical protein
LLVGPLGVLTARLFSRPLAHQDRIKTRDLALVPSTSLTHSLF